MTFALKTVFMGMKTSPVKMLQVSKNELEYLRIISFNSKLGTAKLFLAKIIVCLDVSQLDLGKDK